MSTLRIGTRGSALALAQARWVASRMTAHPPKIVVLRTSGDTGAPVSDKSRWVDTIEAALVAGEIDLAVHSAKDVPGELAEGTEIAATPARASAHDVLVKARGRSPFFHARIGTSSLRRRAQLLADDPGLDVVDLRGNVDTRLRKLAEGEVDALVLAAAGLERLAAREVGSNPWASSPTDSTQAREAAAQTAAAEAALAIALPLTGPLFVPAPGQGTLALQARVDDPRVREAVLAIDDPGTRAALHAERSAVHALGATCHTPVGVHAADGRLRGFAGLPDGSQWVLDEIDSLDGEELARRMLAAGAGEILAAAEAAA